jgi:TrmH family RNA methyltransferase
MNNWKDSIYFVLVEPREWGNIGSSARAMKNMGFRNLCLVRPPREVTEEAQRMAHNSLDVLDNAERFDTLAEAISDKHIVAGIARRTGKRRGLCLPLEKGVERFIGTPEGSKAALLFGREDRGLYNEEVDECGLVLTIPANKEHPSLNLSHAVMVVAYELAKAEYAGERDGQRTAGKRKVAVSHGELSVLFERITKALRLLDYIQRGDRDIERHIMENLRHFIGRAGITDWELKMLHGLCSQIEKKVPEKEAP